MFLDVLGRTRVILMYLTSLYFGRQVRVIFEILS